MSADGSPIPRPDGKPPGDARETDLRGDQASGAARADPPETGVGPSGAGTGPGDATPVEDRHAATGRLRADGGTPDESVAETVMTPAGPVAKIRSADGRTDETAADGLPAASDRPTGASDSEKPRRSVQSVRLALQVLIPWLQVLKAWIEFLAEIASLLGSRKSAARPWRIKLARREQTVALSDKEIQRLLQRQKDLKDVERLADAAARFKLPESDFFADPAHMERLIHRILQENPPWLHVSRTLAGSEEGGDTQDQQVLWREQETREIQDITLFLPDDNWRDLPLASMTMRPVRHLGEVWQARLLDQVLPPEVLLDRMNRGEVLIPIRNDLRQRLEFRTEQRWMEVAVRKRVPITIECEGTGGQGGQLLYVLLDGSASMRGISGTLALAAIAAALRANLGQRNSRYLFRRYAEQDALWPPVIEPPVEARTLEEKDALVDLICATNFNGGATHVNHAITVAISDVQALRRKEQLEASILLVTDGRAEMLESTGLRLRETGIKLHTVMVAPEPNPSLAAISESFAMLDIGADIAPAAPATVEVVVQPRRRKSFQI